MVQKTDYPWSGTVSITVNPEGEPDVQRPDPGARPQRQRALQSAPAANGIASITVNGAAVKPAVEKGYAVMSRTWKAGDKIELVLPLKVQRVHAVGAIAATQDKVALRYGPLVYNIEQADQDITQVLDPAAPLSTEWRGDLLGGVMVIKGAFAGGNPMLAIPNYARYNRGPVPPPAPPKPAAAPATTAAAGQAQPAAAQPRPAPRPPTSIVWIKER